MDPSTAPLGPGQIRDANRAMLLAAAAKAGAEVRGGKRRGGEEGERQEDCNGSQGLKTWVGTWCGLGCGACVPRQRHGMCWALLLRGLCPGPVDLCPGRF